MNNFTSNKNGTTKLTAANTVCAARAIYSEFSKPESTGLRMMKKLRLAGVSLLLVLLSLVCSTRSYATNTVAYSGGGTTAQNVYPGEGSVPIYTFSVACSSGTTDYMTAFTFTTTGTATSSDISSYSVYVTNVTVGNFAPQLVGTVTPTNTSPESYSISPYNGIYIISPERYVFTIVANFTTGATAGHAIAVNAELNTSVHMSAAPGTSGTTSAGGAATVVTNPLSTYVPYSGASTTYTTPAGCSNLLITAAGAQGGGSGNYAEYEVDGGGEGGIVTAMVTATAATTYTVSVGGVGQNCITTTTYALGGFNGGANGGYYSGYAVAGGGGGGATDVCAGSFSAANLLVVAGGGGGAGGFNGGTFNYCAGGAGGSASAGGNGGNGVYNGSTANTADCGQGGTQSAGGAKATTGGANNGALLNGGAASASSATGNYAGGGGGGYYGGGAGGTSPTGGAGGGSSYVAGSASTTATYTQGGNLGNGYVVITPVFSITATNGGAYCAGGSGVNIGLANSLNNVTYTLWLGATSEAVVTPGGGSFNFTGLYTAGIYSITATATNCPTYTMGTITVSSITAPNLSGWASPTTTAGCATYTNNITVNCSTLAAGTYTVTYSISGGATGSGLTATLTMGAGGTGTFTTPTLSGSTTTVTIASITNSTGCSTSAPGSPSPAVTFPVNTVSPVLTPGAGVTYANIASNPITFTLGSAYSSNITSVTAQLGAGTIHTLTLGTDYTVSTSGITLIPNGTDNYITTAGTYNIAVYANGYCTATVSQPIAAGAAHTITVSTAPTAPATNGGALGQQPIIQVVDQYNNLVTGAVVTASASSATGTWTIGGTLTATSASGLATFSSLTAYSSAYLPTATIAFNCPGCSQITTTFGPIPFTWHTLASSSYADLSQAASWTANADGSVGTTPPNFTNPGQVYEIDYGSAPSLAHNWTVSGTGSYVIVGNGTTPITFAIPSGNTLTGTINVSNNGTLDINNATLPTLGTLAANSTIVFDGAASYTFPSSTGNNYGNVTMNTTGTTSFTNNANTTFNILGNWRCTGSGTGGTNGVVKMVGATATNPAYTFNVGGNFTITNATEIIFGDGSGTGTAPYVTVNISGNDTISGSAYYWLELLSTPTVEKINMIGGTLANPTYFYQNSPSAYVGFVSFNGVTVINEEEAFAPAYTSAGYGSMTVNGTLIMAGTSQIYDVEAEDIFTVASGATLEVANPLGINNTGNTFDLIKTLSLNSGANYIFNGTSSQVTGTSLPGTISSGGSVTCNNTSGVTFSNTTTFSSGSSIELENGQLGGANIIFNSGDTVDVDGGSFSGTLPAAYSTSGIQLVYNNLGNNSLAVTTGSELPSTFVGNVYINKPGATISLGSSASLSNAVAGYGNVILTNGILSGGSTTLSLKGNWSNNEGTTAFNAGTGEVNFNGTAAQTIGGTFATTFNDLNIDNTSVATPAVSFSYATSIGSGAILGLQAGQLSVTNLTMATGSTLIKDGGTLSTALSAPNYSLVYGNLGQNTTGGTNVTSTEWPLSYTGSVQINYAGNTIYATQNNTASISSFTLTNGIYNGSSYTLRDGGNFTNNAGATAFTPATSTVNMTGASSIIGGTYANQFNNLTINAAEALGSNATVSNQLTVGGNILSTAAYNITCPSTPAISRTATGWVNGNLIKAYTGSTSTLTFEVGDVDYAPVTYALTGSSSGSIGTIVQSGSYSAIGSTTTSVISASNDVAHYWTVTQASGTPPATIAPTFTYNSPADYTGSNSAYAAQLYTSGSWGAVINPTNSGGASSTSAILAITTGSSNYTGTYVIGANPTNTPPALNPFFTPTVDNLNLYPITFFDDGIWGGLSKTSGWLITSQRIGSTVVNTLTYGTDYTTGTGGSGILDSLSLRPGALSSHTYFDTVGTYIITVFANTYTGASVQQNVKVGAATQLVSTQTVVGPTTNGGVLATQPIVNVEDQYGNLTPSTAIITAAVGTGVYTLSATNLSYPAASGILNYASSDPLSASSNGPVTNATITFSSPGLIGTTSNIYTILAPNPPGLVAAAGATVDNPFVISITPVNATWFGDVTTVTAQYGGTVNTLSSPTDYTITSGTLTLNPNSDGYLTSVGNYTITVNATGFSSTSCVQAIGIGVPNELVMVTQPTGPGYNGGTLATQPAVAVADQYGNIETGYASVSVSAAVGSGSWTLSGPTTSASTNSVTATATFSNLTATSTALVSGATITFSAAGLAPVTSAGFNIPPPPSYIWYNVSTATDLSQTTSWTNNSSGTASVSPSSFNVASSEYIIQNGTSPASLGTWSVTGLGSYIVVGNSSANINFNANANQIIGNISVTANATLTYGNSTLPTFGTLSSLSTVVLTGTQTIPVTVTWGNLTFSGTTGTISTGSTNILGNYTQTSGTVQYTGTGVMDFNVSGNFTMTGGTFNGCTTTTGFPEVIIDGNLSLSGSSVYESIRSMETFLYGNITATGTSAITCTSGTGSYDQEIFMENTSSTYSNPQQITLTSSGAIGSSSHGYVVLLPYANTYAQFNSSYASNTYFEIAVQPAANFIFPTGVVLSGSGIFYVNATSTVYCANATGLNGAVTSSGTTSADFLSGSNYVFNGNTGSTQTTGSYLPAPISGSFVTINTSGTNPTVSLSSAKTFPSGSILNLENGTMSTANLTVSNGANINVDNGTFGSAPTYPGGGAGVNITYENLGNNSPALTTGFEWPGNFTGNVTINKPSATITLNSIKTFSVTSNVLTLTAGTLDVSTSNYNITTAGSWANNAGTSAFTARNGNVIFNGGSGIISGSYGTTFNTLTIDANTTLSAATSFASGTTLDLETGVFSNGTNLSMSSGSNVNVDGGSLGTAPSVYSGVNLTYNNQLGSPASPTTSNEWPLSFTGSVTINKPGAYTVTTGGNHNVTGNITITAGTFNGSSYNTALTGTWSNSGTFTPSTGTVTFNGNASQTTAGSAVPTFYNLTLNNSAGLTLGNNTAVTNLLTLSNGIITTGSYTLSVPGSVAVSRTPSTSTNYVNGNLSKTLNGSSAVNFEVGDNNDYASVSILPVGTATGGSMTVKSTAGTGSLTSTPGCKIDATYDVSHYWTMTPVSITGISSVTPTFSYNNADIGGGTNAGWLSQIYNNSTPAWLPVNTTNTTDPSGNTTTITNVGISTFSTSGNFLVGLYDNLTPPTFTVATGVNEVTVSSNPNTYTGLTTGVGRPSMEDWTSHITQVLASGPGGTFVLGNTSTPADYAINIPGSTATVGTFTLMPTSADHYLTTSGVYTITVSSTAYVDAQFVETINAGPASAITMSVQPTTTANGVAFSPVVVVNLTDLYSNPASGSATITANAVAGTGGATTAWTNNNNVQTSTTPVVFTAMDPTSLGNVTGASINFTGVVGSTTLTPTTSNNFNIGAPAAPVLTAASGATVDAPFSITYTDNPVWDAAVTTISVNGTTLSTGWAITAVSGVGYITFTPSVNALLESSGTKAITVAASGYSNDILAGGQLISAGVGAKLVMTQQPTAPAFNGAGLAVQPKVTITDYYGNATSSSAAVTAGPATSPAPPYAWILGGTITEDGSGGVVTYSDLSASSSFYDAGVAITFSITPSGGYGYPVGTVTSGTFNIPNPPITYWDVVGTGKDLSQTSNWTTSNSGSGGTPPTLFSSNSQKFIIKNGTNPTLSAAGLPISGTGSYLQVGNDTATGVNFIVPSGESLTGPVNVTAGGTLTTANLTMPTFGTLDGTSTIVFNGTSQAIPVTPTYGNLTFNGTTGTVSGTLNVGGTFSVTGSSALTAAAGIINVTGPMYVSGGTLTNSGSGTINLSSDLNVTGSGAITATTANTINFINTSTTQNITWTGGANSHVNFADVAGNTLSLNSGLPLGTGSGLAVNGTLLCGTNAVSGSGTFNVSSGGTINTANATGLTGSIATSGTKTFTAGANYVFSATGSVATPWNGAPGAPNNVTLGNSVTTMTNNQAFAPTGTLTIPTGATLDMSTFALGGAPTIANSGTLQTEYASTAPFPSTITNYGGTVVYGAGTTQVMGATYNNLQLSGSTSTLRSSTSVTGTMTLTSSLLTLGSSNLTLSNAVSAGSSFSATNQIVATGNGIVNALFSANGSYTYPIGDGTYYTPMTLNVTGSSYASASMGVNVTASKNANNYSTNNYLNRYWTVLPTGITGVNYSATATFANPADVTGAVGSIYMGAFNGSLPWIEYGVETGGNTLTATGVTKSGYTYFTGLDGSSPVASVSAASVSICNGGSATLDGSSSTGDGTLSYSWAPTTGLATPTSVTTTATSTITTTYTLTVTDGDGFTSTATSQVVVNSAPVLISYTPPSSQSICEGSAITLAVTDTGGAGTATYTWSGPGITTGNTTSVPSLSYNANATGSGQYTISVSYDGSGCGSSAPLVTALTYSVNALPASLTATVTPNPVCVNSSISLSGTSTGGFGVTYVWTGGTSPISNNTAIDGSAGIASTQLNDAGIYTLAASAAGCITSSLASTGSLVVNQLPTTLTATVTPNPVCVNSSISLSGTSTGGSGVTYAWTGGTSPISNNTAIDGSAGIASTQSDDAGIYTLAASAAGCLTSSLAFTGTLVVNQLPATLTASVNPNPVCRYSSMTLTATSSGGEGSISYAWTGGTSIINNNTDITGTAGITSTQLTDATAYTVTASVPGCSTSTAATAVLAVDTVAVSPTNSSYACFGGTVNLYSGETGTAPSVTYAWSGPLGYIASTSNPSLTGVSSANAGIYSVTATSTLSGCVAMGTTNVTIDTISVTPTNDGYACNGGTVNMYSGEAGTAPSVTYAWSGPDSYSSASGNPTITNAATSRTGTYTVTATSAGSGCSVTGTTSVTVDTFNVLASNTSPACVGNEVDLNSVFVGTVSPTTYSWNGPLGFNSSATGTVLTDSAILGMAGVYTLNISASGSGCSVTKTTTVTVNPIPVPIVGDLNLCIGLTQQLTDYSVGGSWSSIPGTTATVNSSGLATGVSAGTATIYYTFGTGCNVFAIATVDPSPSGIAGTKSVCIGAITSLSDTAAGGSWISGNSNATVDGSGNVQGVSAGTVTITYIFPGGCFRTTAVTVNPLPAIILGNNTVCMGSTTQLTDATTGGTWTSTNTLVATTGTLAYPVTVTGVSAGTSTLIYTLPTTGCTRTFNVTVNAISPVLGSNVVCASSTTTLSDATGAGTWTSSTTGVATVDGSGDVTGVAHGTSKITYTSSLGCTATAVVSVQAMSAISGSTVLCQNTTTTLSDLATGGTWTSSNTGIATVGTSGIVSGGSTSGTATITYAIGSTGCSSNTTVTVNAITVILGTPGTVCMGTTTMLSDATGGGVWSSSNSGLASVDGSGTVNGIAAGTVTITYLESATGCKTTGIMTIAPISAIHGGTTMCSAATITLSDATSGGSWSSSNTAAATIGSTGSPVTVTGAGAGSTTISYITTAGCSSSLTINVNQSPVIGGTSTVCAGLVTTLTDNISGGSWTSSNTAKATVDASGDVSGVAAGTSVISYVITGCGTTMIVSVNANPTAILGGNLVCAGNVLSLSDATAGGSWSTTSGVTLTGTGGSVTGVTPGTAAVTYTLGSGCLTSSVVTVAAPPTSINGSNVVCAGGTITLSDGVSGGTWSSSSTGVATIGSASGILSANLGGTANITYATASGCITTMTVTVNPIMAITGGTNICTGNTLSLADGTSGGTWSTSSAAISVVGSTGVVTAISVDTATVVYTVASGCSRTTLISVNPSPTPIAGVLSLCAGMSTTLSDDGGGSWSMSTLVATVVGSTGVVTASNSYAGTGTVTYTAGAGCTATAVVTVSPNPGAIQGANTECIGATVSLSDATAGGSWSSTSGVTVLAGTGATATLTAGSTSGTAVVSYMLPGGCSVTVINTIKPSPAPIQGATTICVGGVTMLSDATSGVVSWSSSNTGVASAAGGDITGVSAGSATITYLVNTGCSTTTTVNVINVSQITGNTAAICPNTTLSLTDAAITGTWSSSNNTVATVGTDGTVSALASGTTTISFVASGVSGCGAATIVTVSALPVAISGAGSGNMCSNATLSLSDATAGGSWTSGNTSVATVGTGGLVSGVGAGSVVITYTGASGCSVITNINVNAAPGAIMGTTAVCVGSTSALSDNVSDGTWSSSVPAHATIGASSGILSGAATGTSIITYSTGSCSTTIMVSVNAQPGAILGATSLCSGSTAQLSDLTAGGSWNATGVGSISSGGLVSAGATAGTTTVVYATAAGCNVSSVITTNLAPGTLSGPTGMCAGSTITLSDLVSGGNWSVSNALISVDGSGDVTADSGASGTATVTYTLAGGCYTTASITVTNLPSAILGSTLICAGSNVSLSNTSTGGAWTSGSPSIATVGSANGTVTGVAAGTAMITYAVGSGCSTSETVTVYPVPEDISGNVPLCEGGTLALSDTGSGTWSLLSSLAASVNSSTGVVTASAAHTGTATVTYTAAYTGCMATTTVTVNAVPTAILGTTAECPGTSVTLTDATAGGAWSGSGDATVSGSGTSGTLVAGAVSGSATVTYTIPGGCYITATNTIYTGPTPIQGTTTVCVGGTTILTDATGGTSSWSSSNTAFATVAGGDVTGVAAGTATVTYSLGTGGCTTTATITIQPAAVISGNSGAICPAATLSLSSGAGTWSSSNTTIASVNGSGLVTGVSGGQATISFTPTGTGGCVATTIVTINAAPAISGAASVCATGTTTLSDGVSGGTWTSGNMSYATVGSNSGIVSGVSAGSVVITYTTPTTACLVTTTLTVTTGTSAIGGTGGVCVGNTITLTDATGGGTWTSSNTTLGTVDGSGDVTGLSSGVITITYTAGGCTTTGSVSVNALPGAINGPATVCLGTPTSLTDAISGGAWSVSGGTASIGSTGIITGTSAGSATVSYTLTTGCSSSKSITVISTAAGISGNSVICTGSTITVTDGTSGGTWTSANTAVVTVGSSTGLVSGIGSGTTTITYSLGGCYVTAIATVNGAVGVIKGGTSVCQGATLSLSDATAGGTWSSSSTAIATVGASTGSPVIISAVNTGSPVAATVIISYATAGCSTSATITVNPVPTAINGTLSLCPTTSTTLTDAISSGVWSMSSLDASVVGSTGVVTASASYTGTATISYSIGSCATTAIMTVNPNPKAIQGAITECPGVTTLLSDATAGGTWTGGGDATVSGTGTAGTLVAGAVGGSATVTYTLPTGCMVTGSNTIYASPAPIMGNFNLCVGLVNILSDASPVNTWSSSNTTIATAAGGDITGVAAGTATITFKTGAAGTCTTTQVVTVNAMPVVTAINGPATISHSGSPVSISDGTSGGIWTSSNTSVITLSGSTGSPVFATAVTTSGSSVISYAVTMLGCTTTVTKNYAASTAAHPGSGNATVYAGSAVSIADDVSGGNWSSSDNGIATVDENGLVTGIAPGAASISHTITGDDGATTTGVTNVVVSAVPASISLVPNPNKGTFVVKGTTGSVGTEEVTLEVTDVLGQVIYKTKVTAQDGKLNETITLSTVLANGMYILNVQSGTENKTLHFVIEQ